MILSAIYIENHFLFEKPQIINFGGKSIFDFKLNKGVPSFIRETNLLTIENYFGDISLISAIVGANGAGKTNLLRIINQQVEEVVSMLIYEDGEKISILNRSSIIFKTTNFDFIELKDQLKLFPLYYSPNIDYDLQDIYSPISLSRTYNESLSEFYFDNLERQLFFLNNPKIKVLQDAFPDLPFFTNLNIKLNNFNKNQFLNIYKDSNIGSSLNKELEHLWEKYKSNSEFIHNNDDFLKNLKIMLLTMLVLDDTFIKTNDNGTDIGFEEVMTQKTFTKKLNKFLEKRICNIDGPTYSILKNSYPFDINNIEELTERIKRISTTKIPGGFEFSSIKESMIRCINAFKAVNEFYKFIRNFNFEGRIKYENGKEFVEFSVKDYDEIKQFIDEYQTLISKFKETIQHSNFRLLNFYPDKKLSTGEKSLIDFFSSLNYFTIDKTNHIRKNENYLLLLDEPELGYHALWKKKFIEAIVKVVPLIFHELEKKPKVQIIFTTHDALTLSDIPNYNIILIDKDSKRVLPLSETLDKKAFGGNITDILADSFFIGDGLIGDYAKNKIQDVIEYINIEKIRSKKKWITSHEVAKKVINQIGEPYLSEKLNDMFLEAFPEFKNEEIKRLEEKLKQLRYDSDSSK